MCSTVWTVNDAGVYTRSINRIMLWNHAPKTASLTVQPVPNLQSQRFDYYHIVNRINIPTGSS